MAASVVTSNKAPVIVFAFVLGVVCGALAMLGASVLDGDVDTERHERR